MLQVFRYSLPFLDPLRTAIGTISHRDGLILRYENALGEIAPLPGFSSESLEDASTALASVMPDIRKALESADHNRLMEVAQSTGLPSIAFGLDTLWHNLQSTKHGTSALNRSSDLVPSNAVVSWNPASNDPVAEALQKISATVKAGFGTIKLAETLQRKSPFWKGFVMSILNSLSG